MIPVRQHPELKPANVDQFGHLEMTPETEACVIRLGLGRKDITPMYRLAGLQREANMNPGTDVLAAFCELGYYEAVRLEKSNPELAGEIYISVVLNSYKVLFDPALEAERNTFGQQYRSAVRYYNQASERLFRMVAEYRANNGWEPVAPGSEFDVDLNGLSWRVRCTMGESVWNPEEIGGIRFASDIKVEGLDVHYGQEGLGIPVIVSRKRCGRPEEVYYSSDLALPMTLFLRPNPKGGAPLRVFSTDDGSDVSMDDGAEGGSKDAPREPNVFLEFHDPFVSRKVKVGDQTVPLAVDLTTPLSYNCANPRLNALGTLGLTRPESFFETVSDGKSGGRPIAGFYMVAPYDPNKIPVVFVHGLWSTPMTWLAMVGALQNDTEIWNRCQFWFWCYPTGLPWWVSAAGLRNDLDEIFHRLDPEGTNPRFDDSIVIGYSMGGLIARLQVCDSGDEAWKLVSDLPFETPGMVSETEMDGNGDSDNASVDWNALGEAGIPLEPGLEIDPETQDAELLRKIFFFRPNPRIKRVVTIATPFKGSCSVNPFSQWFADKLIMPPESFQSLSKILNSARIRGGKKDSVLSIRNSIDAMSPDCPFLEAMDRFEIPENVALNNIIGMTETGVVFRKLEGDKIVLYDSAHRGDVESEISVDSCHTYVHTNPESIREVERILHGHLQNAMVCGVFGSDGSSLGYAREPVPGTTGRPPVPRLAGRTIYSRGLPEPGREGGDGGDPPKNDPPGEGSFGEVGNRGNRFPTSGELGLGGHEVYNRPAPNARASRGTEKPHGLKGRLF